MNREEFDELLKKIDLKEQEHINEVETMKIETIKEEKRIKNKFDITKIKNDINTNINYLFSKQVRKSLCQLYYVLSKYNVYKNEILTDFSLKPEKLLNEDSDFKWKDGFRPQEFEYKFEKNNDNNDILEITFCHYKTYAEQRGSGWNKTTIWKYYSINSYKIIVKYNIKTDNYEIELEVNPNSLNSKKKIYILKETLKLLTEEKFYKDINEKLLTEKNIKFN